MEYLVVEKNTHIQQAGDVRYMPSPLLDGNNIELNDIATNEEVDDDECFRGEAMNIDYDKVLKGHQRNKVKERTTYKMIHTNERKDKAVKNQAPPYKRNNPMPETLNAREGQSMQRSIPSQESIQKEVRSKLSVHKSMIQSSSRENSSKSPIIGRTQGEGETQHDIQEMQSCKKVKKLVLPAMSLNNFLKEQPDIQAVDEGDFATHEVVEDACFRDEAMDTDCAKDGASEKKKVHGRRTCKSIDARNFEEREEVTFDKGQAIGPTDKRVSDLSNFLGTIARNSTFITLLYTSWQAVPKDTKRRMWEYVNSKFIIPARGEKWVMDGLRDAWKQYKRRIKKNHFDGYDTIEDMLENCPKEILEVQFRQLFDYWKLPAV